MVAANNYSIHLLSRTASAHTEMRFSRFAENEARSGLVAADSGLPVGVEFYCRYAHRRFAEGRTATPRHSGVRRASRLCRRHGDELFECVVSHFGMDRLQSDYWFVFIGLAGLLDCLLGKNVWFCQTAYAIGFLAAVCYGQQSVLPAGMAAGAVESASSAAARLAAAGHGSAA